MGDLRIWADGFNAVLAAVPHIGLRVFAVIPQLLRGIVFEQSPVHFVIGDVHRYREWHEYIVRWPIFEEIGFNTRE
ncbi:hypothetical protein D3C71_1752200 [compost metagenome]